MGSFCLPERLPSILRGLKRQRESKEFCDVILQLGDISQPVHACLIAAASSEFGMVYRQFFENVTDNGASFVIKLDDVVESHLHGRSAACQNILDHFISYIYGDAISIPQDLANALGSIAKALQMDQLVEQCCQFLGTSCAPETNVRDDVLDTRNTATVKVEDESASSATDPTTHFLVEIVEEGGRKEGRSCERLGLRELLSRQCTDSAGSSEKKKGLKELLNEPIAADKRRKAERLDLGRLMDLSSTDGDQNRFPVDGSVLMTPRSNPTDALAKIRDSTVKFVKGSASSLITSLLEADKQFRQNATAQSRPLSSPAGDRVVKTSRKRKSAAAKTDVSRSVGQNGGLGPAGDCGVEENRSRTEAEEIRVEVVPESSPVSALGQTTGEQKKSRRGTRRSLRHRDKPTPTGGGDQEHQLPGLVNSAQTSVETGVSASPVTIDLT